MKKKIKNEEVKEQEAVSEPTATAVPEPATEPRKVIGYIHASGNEDFNKVVGKINEIIDHINK